MGTSKTPLEKSRDRLADQLERLDKRLSGNADLTPTKLDNLRRKIARAEAAAEAARVELAGDMDAETRKTLTLKRKDIAEALEKIKAIL